MPEAFAQLPPTPVKYGEIVLSDMHSFMRDHADWERRCAQTALDLIGRYSYKVDWIKPLTDIAIAELKQFKQVYQLMESKKIELNPGLPDSLYLKQLSWKSRQGKETRFIDHIIINVVSSWRTAERFRLVTEVLSQKRLKTFYEKQAELEEQLADNYLNLLEGSYSSGIINERLEHFIQEEQQIISNMELRPAVH